MPTDIYVSRMGMLRSNFLLLPAQIFTVMQVENLLRLYNSIDVPAERLLFKIPATWQVSTL